MCEDARGTQWNRAGFVYTRVSRALESGKNDSLLLALRFVSHVSGSQNKRGVL